MLGLAIEHAAFQRSTSASGPLWAIAYCLPIANEAARPSTLTGKGLTNLPLGPWSRLCGSQSSQDQSERDNPKPVMR